MKEMWKDIAGFEGLYRVSSHGRIKSMSRERSTGNGVATYKGRIIAGYTRKDGYVTVNLYKKGVPHIRYLHRIVAKTFIENTSNRRTVNHIDGNPSNNTADNLEWASYSENHKHAYVALGRKNNRSMLNKTGKNNKRSTKVIQLKDGKPINIYYGMREAERITGIRNSAISAVCNGKQSLAGGYKWVKADQLKLKGGCYDK